MAPRRWTPPTRSRNDRLVAVERAGLRIAAVATAILVLDVIGGLVRLIPHGVAFAVGPAAAGYAFGGMLVRRAAAQQKAAGDTAAAAQRVRPATSWARLWLMNEVAVVVVLAVGVTTKSAALVILAGIVQVCAGASLVSLRRHSRAHVDGPRTGRPHS